MSKLIDINFIKENVDITEEELMHRLVKDAVKLMEEAEENARRKEVESRIKDSAYDIDFVKDFFNSYTYFSKWFSDEEILLACKKNMSKTDLTKEECFRGFLTTPIAGRNMRFVRNTVTTFTEKRGSWTRKVKDDASVFLVPNPYQNISGGKEVTRALLEQKCPWVKEYHVDIYDITTSNDWIFFKNPDGKGAEECLYVPFSALMEHDVEKIKDTHQRYWKQYNNSDTTEFLNGDFVKGILKHVLDDAV